jgi:two-component system sensor histidine kinase QseC
VAERASRIDANSLMERFPIEEMPAELQPIAGRLNDLLARLEGSFDRERRFSANLAHELRTPLAELRSQAELALKWPDERTADADRVVLEITLQMETLVERMLALARAEQSPANVKREEIALLPLAGELVAAIRPVVAARGLKIALAVPEEAAISADAVLLRSILSNLLENAANYGRSGGDITVSFSREAGRFALTVANPVDNLGAEDVPRLFERFWRKDSSRTGGTHAGLGLALSRSLAAQMGYSLDAALAANGVIAVTLTGAV